MRTQRSHWAEALLHGNLLHNPDHALLTDQGPVAINWKASGHGPRLADVAYLLWGAKWGDGVALELERDVALEKPLRQVRAPTKLRGPRGHPPC